MVAAARKKLFVASTKERARQLVNASLHLPRPMGAQPVSKRPRRGGDSNELIQPLDSPRSDAGASTPTEEPEARLAASAVATRYDDSNVCQSWQSTRMAV